MMSNEALLDESLISRFSASHHIRFAQKQLKVSNSALIAKSKSCILIKRSSFLGNYFLPNCSLSPFAATAEAIPLMAVLNLLRERPVSSEEHHRPDIYSIVFHFSFYRWIENHSRPWTIQRKEARSSPGDEIAYGLKKVSKRTDTPILTVPTLRTCLVKLKGVLEQRPHGKPLLH